MSANRTNNIIISVQSQKGGVGKTTVALNLASLLLPKYRVLFFDLDIVGTEASTVGESPIWAKPVHVVKFNIGDEQNKSDKSSDNLINLYACYMRGNAVCKFDWLKTKQDGVESPQICFEDKINIFSSSMECKNKKSIYQHAPQVLFDDAHAEWFMDMIREIVESADKQEKPSKEPLAIILDCAPGYSGLGPFVEDWLTDIGPEQALFVIVASADTQDVMACTYALKRLEDVYLRKLKVAKEYHDWMQVNVGSEPPHVSVLDEDNARSFFVRLARNQIDTNVFASLAWYKTMTAERLAHWQADLVRTWALIHNRVPSSLAFEPLSGLIDSIIPDKVLNDEKYKSIGIALTSKIDKRVIHYSESYALQFVARKLIDNGAKIVANEPPIQNKKVLPEPPFFEAPFNCASDFIWRLMIIQKAFSDFAKFMPTPEISDVRIPWHEFSPVWLLFQQFQSRVSKKSLDSCVERPIAETVHTCMEKVRKWRSRLQTKCHSMSESWIEEAFFTLHALCDVIDHKPYRSKFAYLQVLQQRARFIDVLANHDGLGLDKAWSNEPVNIDSWHCPDQLVVSQLKISSMQASNLKNIADQWRSIFLSFWRAYNYIVRSPDAVSLLRAAGQNAFTGETCVLYQVLAESIFHHVLHTRDLPLHYGLQLLSAFETMRVDPVSVFKVFSAMQEMRSMAAVLSPICNEHNMDVG